MALSIPLLLLVVYLCHITTLANTIHVPPATPPPLTAQQRRHVLTPLPHDPYETVVTGDALEARTALITLYSTCDDELAGVRASYDPSEAQLRELRQCFVNRASLYADVITKYAQLASVRGIAPMTDEICDTKLKIMYELMKRGVPYYGSIYDDDKIYKRSIILWMKEFGYYTNTWTCLHKLDLIDIGRLLDVGHDSYFSYVYAEVHNSDKVYYEDAHEHDMPFEDFRGTIDGLCKEHAERVHNTRLAAYELTIADDERRVIEAEIHLFRHRPHGRLTDEQESRQAMYLDLRPKLKPFGPNDDNELKPYQQFLLAADGSFKPLAGQVVSDGTSSLGFDPRSLAIEMELERLQRQHGADGNGNGNGNDDDVQSPEEYDFFKNDL